MARSTTMQKSPDAEKQAIYYFAYGPVVNDMVRQRRGVKTTEIKAAYLPEYRLTFAFGGNANIVRARGYEAHGLLMKLESEEDWMKLNEFDAGNEATHHAVIPYDSPDDPVVASFIEMPCNLDTTLLDTPIERLPQERYLKLISRGMRQYKVDGDYIDDQILAVPFIPTRKPDNYFRFPEERTPIPRITFERYLKKCDRARVKDDLYFVLGASVFRLDEHDPANPLALWFEKHGHGKDDCTLMVHKTVVDPDIPICDDKKDITPLHIAWAENNLVEVIEQYGMGAKKVGILVKDGEDDDSSSQATVVAMCCRCRFRNGG